ncbi:hypothetical protein [Streptomyces sp. PanSC9]|uniref:hypothetical protein n=1 Tax=Streptomyces sp. PanSC9 TaxID=1520461 RepID=UPI000F48ED00|nr:hypothetical protein [Streptomyces sp. PanSC9]ROP44178.1 hypothetical protein EDD94_7963 [Streptomyces sp. PanSC9]
MSTAVSTDTTADLQPSPAQAWWRACHYEIRHLAALRSTWILAAIITLVALWVPLAAPFIIESSKDTTDPALVDSVQWTPALMQIPSLAIYLLVLGTGPVSTELMRGASRTTWLTAASRSYAFWAKCAVGAMIGVLVSALTSLLEIGGLTIVAVAKGVHPPLWADLVEAAARLELWMACWMLLCTSVSALIRNRVGPILVLLLVPPLGERTLGILSGKIPGIHLDKVADWLPFAAGQQMLSADTAQGALLGGVIFVVFTAVVATAGHAVYMRRAG